MKLTQIDPSGIQFASLNQMQELLLSLNAKSAALFINEHSIERWKLQDLIQKMNARYQFNLVIANVMNPTPLDIFQALEKIKNQPPEVLIAVGGGSMIDLAKGVSAFYNDKFVEPVKNITDGIRKKTYKNRDFFIKMIAVPTTAGTGSELTQWATIWDMDEKVKYSIDDPRLKPAMALIVPELTLTVSQRLTLSTGLDALAHAVEAYWSKYTTPVVQDIAYRAIQLIIENLKNVLNHPTDIKLREKMCRASVLAGLAFSQTRTTACHSISYPMTMLYGIPHGFAAAMTLAEVARLNQGNFPNDKELFALFDRSGGIQQWLDDTCGDIQVLRLSAFGIKEYQINELVNKSFFSGRMDNNPVNLNEKDVESILTSLLIGKQ